MDTNSGKDELAVSQVQGVRDNLQGPEGETNVAASRPDRVSHQPRELASDITARGMQLWQTKQIKHALPVQQSMHCERNQTCTPSAGLMPILPTHLFARAFIH